jgi:hypothetical protein
LTSADGVAWVLRELDTLESLVGLRRHLNGWFVCVGQDLWVSTDLATWTTFMQPIGARALTGLEFIEGERIIYTGSAGTVAHLDLL